MSNPKNTQNQKTARASSGTCEDELLKAIDQIANKGQSKKGNTTNPNSDDSFFDLVDEVLGRLIRDCRRIRILTKVINLLFPDETDDSTEDKDNG